MTSIVFARILVRHLSDKFDNIFVFAQPSREFLAVFCLSKHLRFCQVREARFGSRVKLGKRIRSVKMITGIFKLSFHLLAAPSEVKHRILIFYESITSCSKTFKGH